MPGSEPHLKPQTIPVVGGVPKNPAAALAKLLGSRVPRKSLEEISKAFVRRSFSGKQTLVSAGSPWDRICYIRQGIVRLFYTDAEGKEFNKGFFLEGQFLWPVAPSARTGGCLFAIETLEPVEAFACGFDDFRRQLLLLEAWEAFALAHAEALAEEKFEREYEFLMHAPQDRYLAFCKKYPGLSGRLPGYHLASYLGMTNVSLSRIKARLRKNPQV